MLEGQWSEALAANNVRTIVHWLKKPTIKGDAGLEEPLQTFGCWLQRTSELTKKEFLTLCFSRCQGLWMFLDQSSFIKVHKLLLRLQNLLTLVQWSRKQLGVGAPCMICRNLQSSDGRHACWKHEYWTLKQHIWLGRLVQWWGIMGLLPRFPEAQELRRISQMWKEMELSHQEMCLTTPGWNQREMGRCGFLIEGMVTQLCKKHGCIWTSEDCTDQCYPPPTLQALLMLVLVPYIDNMSVQGLPKKWIRQLQLIQNAAARILTKTKKLMYFILDVANFLQCKDNLLQSFCHAFTIPSSFSQQIKAFWMFDRGRIKASMELLLSPRAAVPLLPWQHRYIITSLLKRKHRHMALKYLQWTKPPIETIEDAKLCAEVLLHTSCLSEAWTVLKRSHTESEDMVMYFLQACRGANLGAEAVKYIPEGYKCEEVCCRAEASILQRRNEDCLSETAPCPLSATLYQKQTEGTMCSEDLVKLVKKAVTEVRKLHPTMSEVVWPKPPRRKSNSREIFLSVQTLRRLIPSPFSMETLEETEQTANAEDCQEGHYAINSNQPETQQDILSSENQSSLSVSSVSSASSAPLLKHPHVFESTVTLQKMSALLTDEENQCKGDDDEEEEEGPFISELKLTPDGDTGPQTHSSSDNKSSKSQDKVISFALQSGEEDGKHTPRETLTDAATKMLSSVSPKRKDQSDGLLGISGDQEGGEHDQQRETLGCGVQVFSSPPSTSIQDPVADPNQSCVSGDNKLTGSPTMYNATSSGVFGPSLAYGLASFVDFSAKPTNDKQAEGEEPAGLRGKARQQGAMRGGRTKSRKGKQVKRT